MRLDESSACAPRETKEPRAGDGGGEERDPSGDERRREPRGVLSPWRSVDDDLSHVMLPCRQGVRPEQQIAGPALLCARRELRGREEREQNEQGQREADAVGTCE